MVYFVNITGGLGNRLFQIAAGYGLAQDHNTEFKISLNFIYSNPHSKKSYKRFYSKWLTTGQVIINKKYVEDRNCPGVYINIQKVPDPDNVLLLGYFQSEKYFKKQADIIRNVFGPSESETNSLLEKYPSVINCAFIHVRVGDYLDKNTAQYISPELLTKYYERCINEFKQTDPQIEFWLFTNNEKDLEKHFNSIKNNPTVTRIIGINELDEIQTMHLMSLCKHGGICPNSTYSWWGAWLNINPLKKVYMPDRWFPNRPSMKNGDIFFDGVNVVKI